MSLLDPIESIRYKDPRNTHLAADFLQLLGYPISIGCFEKQVDTGRLRSNRDGRIEESVLIRLLKKPPSWLAELPEFPEEDGMLTVRTALKKYPELKPEEVLNSLAIGKYFLRSQEGRRYLVVPESWFRNLGGRRLDPKKSPIEHEMLPERPAEPKAAAQPRTAPAAPPAQAPTPAPKPEPVISSNELVKAPATQELKVTEDDQKKAVVPLMEAVQFLQAYGFDITHNDLYYLGIRSPKKKIKVIRKAGKRYLYMRLSELEKLVDHPPKWLREHKRRYPEINGYLMTRDVIIKYRFVAARLYMAVSAELLEAMNAASDEAKGQGKLYYISEQEVERVLTEELLCRYLRGENVTIPEIVEARKNAVHAPEAHRTPVDVPEVPGETEVIHLVGESKQPFQPGLTFDEAMKVYVDAVRVVKAFERATSAGMTNEEIAAEIQKANGDHPVPKLDAAV